MLKSYDPFDLSVSPSPFGLDFGTLDFGLGLDKTIGTSLSMGGRGAVGVTLCVCSSVQQKLVLSTQSSSFCLLRSRVFTLS